MAKSTTTHAPETAYDSSGSGALTQERTNTMPRTGRPLTGPGHRDDAMLRILDFEGRIDAHIRTEQTQYRERRDSLVAMKEDLRAAALSWRYGEIVDQQVTDRAAEIAGHMRGER